MKNLNYIKSSPYIQNNNNYKNQKTYNLSYESRIAEKVRMKFPLNINKFKEINLNQLKFLHIYTHKYFSQPYATFCKIIKKNVKRLK